MARARKKFGVEWAESAADDLMEIVDRVADDGVDRAARVLDRLTEAGASLTRFPLRGRVVPELRHHGVTQYRELIVRPWRIVYRVGDATVYVLAVIDGRRHVEDVLLDRLLR